MNRNTIIRIVLGIIVLLIVITLVIGNRFNFFNFLGVRIPVLIAIVGIFVAGWCSSKALDGVVNYKDLQKKYEELEDSLGEVVEKGVKEAQKTGETIKEKVEEANNEIEKSVQRAKSSTKKPTATASKRKTTTTTTKTTTSKRTPQRRTKK